MEISIECGETLSKEQIELIKLAIEKKWEISFYYDLEKDNGRWVAMVLMEKKED